jgi:hypothetical protein
MYLVHEKTGDVKEQLQNKKPSLWSSGAGARVLVIFNFDYV